MQQSARDTVESEIKCMARETRVAASLLHELGKDTFDAVYRQGAIECNPEELAARVEAARTSIRACAVPPFDPVTRVGDRQLLGLIANGQDTIAKLQAKREILETRLTNAREQTWSLPVPVTSRGLITATGTGVFTLAFAPTIYTCFLNDSKDTIAGWAVAILMAALVGGFLCLLALRSEAAN